MENVIQNEGGQVRSVTGPKAVEAFRLRSLIVSLEVEMRGMRLSRHVSALAIAKRTTGLKSNKREVHIAALKQMLSDALAACTIINA